MNIRFLFFGATADEIGGREIDFYLGENTTAKQALAEVIEKYPQLGNHKLLIAVNQSYVPGEEMIRDGDELAIFTAVSGG